ncbi:protein LDB19 [Helicocarpus griseus UAMH5409]|uniref:Protein LDB19 n=1 Tax=Helicocarpus griseus UAMH5409 TaxID=1447875 RepID=A0A2B7WRL8_9EURO|nr:protein LDB19 [Helicocarpus griseus UAMH5409]
MPGRLLSSLVRSSAHSPSPVPHDQSDRDTIRTSSSSSSHRSTDSIKNYSGQDPPSEGVSGRRLSFSMDHLIHPHRNRDHKGKRRNSIYPRPGDKSSHNNSAVASLDIVTESPPLVLYGSPSQSTGALMSGRLVLSVADVPGEITLTTLRMQLYSGADTKKPVSNHCLGCKERVSDLTTWEFLTDAVRLKSGTHDYPFSYLFPGNIPATTHASLGSIFYMLSAYAVTTTGEEFRLEMPVKIKRAIMPGVDKSSMRIFPPTNLVGRAIMPSVVHPIGNFNIQFTLTGVVEKREENQVRWRLRKLMWRIEEHQKIAFPACSKHAHRMTDKNSTHQETRIIGNGEQKSGWKTDFDTAGGEIRTEFEANIRPGSNPSCRLTNPTIEGGLQVKHEFVMELIVAEEFCPNHNTKLITPTGAARVLRMVFQLHVTERGGLGISWDEEMPPVYTDVPASPPGYVPEDASGCPTVDRARSTIEDYTGPPLPDYEDLEHTNGFDDSSDSHQGLEGLSRYDSRELGRRLTTDDLETEPQLNDLRPERQSEDELAPDISMGSVA